MVSTFLAFVRKHLSNRDTLQVLAKIKKCKFVLITDEVPKVVRRRDNPDIRAGSGTRANLQGGLFLENSPFERPLRVVLETDTPQGIILRTVLLDNTVTGEPERQYP